MEGPTEATERDQGGRDRALLVAIGVCAVMLIGGYLLKAQCLAPEAFPSGHQYSRLCYNDIQPLFGIRSVSEGAFPYINGEYTEDAQLIGGAVEYPVLTGLFLWLAGLFANEQNSYFQVSALLLAPFGLLTAYLLARMTGWRALMWAASPALVYYSFHNWDLLVVAAVVAGMWFWYRGKPLWAAALFGVGAALKLYPILFVIPLALERWVAGKRPQAVNVVAAGSGALLALNLPFMVINFSGWWATYAFHKDRTANYDSIWTLAQTRWTTVTQLQMPTLNQTVAVLTLLTFGAALLYGFKRARTEGIYPFLPVAGAMLVAFLLWNKVHSPQYTLWLLPFFVLLSVHWLWWLGYAVVDTVAYVSIFKWFFDIVYEGEVMATPAKNAMIFAVWARAVLLLVLLVVFLRARNAVEPEDRELLSHPPPKLDPVGDPA